MFDVMDLALEREPLILMSSAEAVQTYVWPCVTALNKEYIRG